MKASEIEGYLDNALKNRSSSYTNGFLDCWDLLLPLVRTLELYAITNETFPEYGDVAREALTQLENKLK